MTLGELLGLSDELIPHQICCKCGESKPITEFRTRGEGTTPKRILKRCIECDKKNSKLMAVLHKTAPAKPDACQCCGKVTNKLVLDHDHTTYKFRGWICDSCNVGISRLGDSKEIVKLAYDYLVRYESCQKLNEEL
jgi:uncharacterized ferredoxin-like protein